MANEIIGGRDVMRVHMYGTMSNDTFDYIQSRIDNMHQLYGDNASWFTNRLTQRFQEGAVRSLQIAQSNLEYSDTLFEEGVRTLRTIDDFRSASRNNQQYILSHGYFYREQQANRIEAWGYQPLQYSGYYGEDNPYYQNAVDGVMQYGDEDLNGESEDKFVIYSNEQLDELIPFKLNESIIVRNNWFRLYNLINQEGDEVEDPTSIHGSYL